MHPMLPSPSGKGEPETRHFHFDPLMVVRYRACYLAESCYKNRANYMAVVTTLNFNGQTEAAFRHYAESLSSNSLPDAISRFSGSIGESARHGG